MVPLALWGNSDMGQHVEVVATNNPNDLPEVDPLKSVDKVAEAKTVMFEGTQYSFPGDATDEEMLAFIGTLPDPDAEPPEERDPLREAKIIKKDEGVVKDKEAQHLSYMDSKRHLTGGHGHLMTKEEKQLYPKGTVIPNDVVNEWFRIDMDEADNDLTSMLEQKKVHVPDEVYDILINMTFNMGKPRVLKFKKMWSAIEVNDWDTAADEMEDSKWFKDVGNRAVRLIGRMRTLAPKQPDPEL